MFKKREQNDVTPILKDHVRSQRKIYGKHGALICSIDENTKQLKELVEELRALKNQLADKDK